MRLIDADVLPKYTGTALSAVDVARAVENAPTIDHVKHGRWIMVPDPYGFFEEIPVCSECGCTTEMRKTYEYCPHCGAQMERSEDG